MEGDSYRYKEMDPDTGIGLHLRRMKWELTILRPQNELENPIQPKEIQEIPRQRSTTHQLYFLRMVATTDETQRTSRSGIAISRESRDLNPNVRGKGSLTGVTLVVSNRLERRG